MLVSQSIIPFKENSKWGYKKDSKVVIIPEYDTAFAFDKTGQIALVANKNKFNKEVNQNLKNPLTGESETMSQEDLMTLALIKKARDGDVNAYKALMDSGYGAPQQTTESLVTVNNFDLKEVLKFDSLKS